MEPLLQNVNRKDFRREKEPLRASFQNRFVILHEVKDPSGYGGPVTRCWILRCAQDDRFSGPSSFAMGPIPRSLPAAAGKLRPGLL